MVFSSHVFIFYFLPLVLLGYYALYKLKVRLSWINLFVTISSYVFYGWFEPWFVTLMWISTIVDYYCGKAISKPDATTFARNFSLTISMVVNLGLLGFFKYYMFAMAGFNKLAELFGADSNLFHVISVTLPIGISFYTFQTMSYTIDVWRGDAPPVKDMKTFSCFVALFPQLIAGPIVRYNTVAEQLAKRSHTLEKFASGAAIFILGFAKKILLANGCGEIANTIFRADTADALSSWWGILAYHFQIYFDFCAYSDMAVGLGRMMGFEFIKNFNAPYLAKSISDFWNRWHISLSTWIRDYLYIALGGNRKGPKRTYVNLLIAMFLCGLWHGAQVTFVVWGVMQSLLLIWERTMGRHPIYHKLPLIPKIVITNIIVMFTWVVFRAPSMDQAMIYWRSMLGFSDATQVSEILRAQAFSTKHLFHMAICAIFVFQPFQAHMWVNKLNMGRVILLLLLFLYAVCAMFTQSFNPFLYFQF